MVSYRHNTKGPDRSGSKRGSGQFDLKGDP